MRKLGVLLGSSTRASILEALALSTGPLTPYRIAKMYGMNVAKTYIEMKKLANLGVLATTQARRGVGYVLADEELRRLVVKFSTGTVTIDGWKSGGERAFRFRAGLQPVPTIAMGRPEGEEPMEKTRLPGELEALATLGRRRFDAKYRATGEREYARV